MFLAHLIAQNPKPTPPILLYDTNGNVLDPDSNVPVAFSEQNDGDESYLAAVQEWEYSLQVKAMNLYFEFGVDLSAEQIAQAQVYRARASSIGIPIPDSTSDKEIYLMYVLAMTPQEIAYLTRVIDSVTTANEEAIAHAMELFSAHVSR
jgi:hypothetical protein